MAKMPPSATEPAEGSARAGISDKAPVVDLNAEELYAVCVAVACSIEDDRPGQELAAVRSVLESVEVRLLSAWADLLLARWRAAASRATAGTTGVTR